MSIIQSLIFILFLFIPLFGQQISPTEILDSIRSHYSLMNDASAAFTQTVKMRYKQSGQQMTGTVKLKKGNKYRIETDQQMIITDGNTVWMYNPDIHQVLIDQYKVGRQPFSPDKFLLGLPKDFSPDSVVQSGDHVILTLHPTAKNTSLTHIQTLKVWTTFGEWIVKTIELIDKNSTITTISLSDIHFNEGIADSVFQFRTTKEMNVVDLKKLQ